MPVAAIQNGLATFQCHLIGTWTNTNIGSDSPYSYCVMPLPQDPPGYILKNFKLTETVQFEGDAAVSSPATAPNRGNTDLQVPTALFYEQNVSFSGVPDISGIVHVENGSWLNLQTGAKLTGPFPPPLPDGAGSGIQLKTPADNSIAKQISVPHGNSILALGTVDPAATGEPAIPDSSSVLPTPLDGGDALDTTVYTKPTPAQKDQNPFPDLTLNPNKTLQDGVNALKPSSYIHWTVTTPASGGTLNIPFEQSAADIMDYTAHYWLLSTDNGQSYKYLAYFQLMNMKFEVGGHAYKFPHVTTNIVTKTATGDPPKGNCGGMQQEEETLRDRAADAVRGLGKRLGDMIDDD